MRQKLLRAGEVAIIAFIALIIVAEVLVYAPPVAPKIGLTSDFSRIGGNLTGSDSLSSTFDGHLRQSFYLAANGPPVSTIYYYYDGAYPYSWSSPTNWFGLSQHLTSIASQRGLAWTLQVVNATQLKNVFTSTDSTDAIVVMASGVFPDTVYRTGLNLVLPWLRSGGTLVWVGDRIGYYSGQPNTPVSYSASGNPGNNGTSQFVNRSVSGGITGSYYNATQTSLAFGVNYTYGLGGDTLNVSVLPSIGGTGLGPVASGFTNVGELPVGEGNLVVFGGPTSNVDELTLAIVNILQSKTFEGRFVLVGSLELTATAGRRVTTAFSFSLPPYPYGNDSYSICQFTYQTELLAPFAYSSCVPFA